MARRTESVSGLLAGDEIKARLERGEIFRAGSWDREQIQAAAYDVRVARDLLFVSGPSGSRRYGVGEFRVDSVILAPGDTALFSTREKCCFPWDLGVFVSVKWGLARQGLLVFTGGFVNPGFGLVQHGRSWRAADDERLHFLVANVGNTTRAITRDDSIATLTFMRLSGAVRHKPAASTQAVIAESYGPQGALVGLGLLTDLAEQKIAVDALNRRVLDIEKGLQPLISFGVYVVAAALLGVVATVAIGFLSAQTVREALTGASSNWSFTVNLMLVLVTALLMLRLLLAVADRLWQLVRRLLSGARTAAHRRRSRRLRQSSVGHR